VGPEVRTATGAVRGRWEDGVAVFRGIPFAAAPVGRRRFAAPQPAAPWDGLRDASFGPPPPQPARATAGDDWLNLAFATTGDPGWTRFRTPQRLSRVFRPEAMLAAYPEERSRTLWGDQRFGVLDVKT
jgi:carboxylesterase type B